MTDAKIFLDFPGEERIPYLFTGGSKFKEFFNQLYDVALRLFREDLQVKKWFPYTEHYKYSIRRFERKIYKYMVGEAFKQSTYFEPIFCHMVKDEIESVIAPKTAHLRKMDYDELYQCLRAQLEQSLGSFWHFYMQTESVFDGDDKECAQAYKNMWRKELCNTLGKTEIGWQIRNTLRTHIRSAVCYETRGKDCYLDVPVLS